MIATATKTELPAKIVGMSESFVVLDLGSVGAYHWPKTHLPESAKMGSELLIGLRTSDSSPLQPQPHDSAANSDFENMRRLLEDLIN